jgi:hypothetical protein
VCSPAIALWRGVIVRVLMAGKVPRILAVILGLIIVVVAVANVQMGFADFGGEKAKINWTTIATSECSSALDGSFEEESEIEDCVGATGLFETPDLIFLAFGLLPLIVGLMPSKKKRGKRNRAAGQSKKLKDMERKYSGQLALGVLMFLMGVAVFMTGQSPYRRGRGGGDSSLPFIEGSIYLIIGLRGASKGWSLRKQTLSFKKKFDEGGGEAADGHSMAMQERMFRDNKLGDPFRGKHKVKGIGNFRTVGEMRQSMNLDKWDDAFEAGMYDQEEGGGVGATCHYCSGQGCAQCNMTGSL